MVYYDTTVYYDTHYGPNWFITKKAKKGFYIRWLTTVQQGQSHWDLRWDELAGSEKDWAANSGWEVATPRQVRSLIKMIFIHQDEF